MLPANVHAPLLMPPSAGNHFPSSPSSTSFSFVPAPSQPSPTDHRSRTVSFGGRAVIHPPHHPSSFRSRVVSRSEAMSSTSNFHAQSTHAAYATADAQDAQAARGHSSSSHMASSTHEHRSRANQRSSGQIKRHPILGDMALIAAVAAASTDHREFLCPILSPCHKKAEWVVPDFSLVLQRIRLSSHGPAMFQRQRVVMIVENKPARDKRLRRAMVYPFTYVENQVTRQAVFAFASDPTLNTLGAIIAFGDV
ncbi:hypothetical protein DFH29DRAFT_993540 [Suillus ampliporus]|nr:hypothetical protein DFH29DRAFT_993540 [Suillus ampliporus]